MNLPEESENDTNKAGDVPVAETLHNAIEEMEEPESQEQTQEQGGITVFKAKELMLLGKEEIVKKYIALQEQNQILERKAKKKAEKRQEQFQKRQESKVKKDKSDEKRNKLFEIYQTQHFAIKLSYVGVNYSGLTIQGHTDNTVEEFLFQALEKATLISSRLGCNFTRSGRTDKGVSALGQVIGVTLRTSLKKGEDPKEVPNKLNYLRMINGILPDEIRLLSIKPVDSSFNARFDCTRRTYQYFFFQNDMDIEKMKEASKLILGEHDFRNLCKIDVVQTTNYVRTIIRIDIEETKLGTCTEDPRHRMFVATIEGNAFLWHMIRNIMAVLFLIGNNKEQPEIFLEMLDIQKQPQKPNFKMAPDYPLILIDCYYPKIKFDYSSEMVKVYEHFLSVIQKREIETQLYISPMLFLQEKVLETSNYDIIQNSREQAKEALKSGPYKPLYTRQLAISSEDSLANLKGRKLEKYNNKKAKQLRYAMLRQEEKRIKEELAAKGGNPDEKKEPEQDEQQDKIESEGGEEQVNEDQSE